MDKKEIIEEARKQIELGIGRTISARGELALRFAVDNAYEAGRTEGVYLLERALNNEGEDITQWAIIDKKVVQVTKVAVAKEIFEDLDKVLSIMDLEEDSDEYQERTKEWEDYEFPAFAYIDSEVDKLEKKWTISPPLSSPSPKAGVSIGAD